MKSRILQLRSRGQIVVVMGIVLVILLGFTALAIDGSMIYSDRRYAQNAADATALAGAGMAAQYMENHHVRYENFTCSDHTVIHAMNYGDNNAITRAATNGFTIDTDISDNLGVHVECRNIQLGSYYDRYLEYTVKLKNTTATTFAHLFYNGPVENQVTAVVRVHPRTNLGMGYAVASLGTDCSTGGMFMHGDIQVETTGAGIFSNSCMDFNGTSLGVTAHDPNEEGIRYITTVTTTGHPSIDPWPVSASIRIKTYTVPIPDCSGLPVYGSYTNHGTSTINPGRYSEIRQTASGAALTLNPGLYCVSGDVYINGGTVTGNGVTFYMPSGSFSVGGNVDVNLVAPMGDTPPAIRGMLIYNTGTGNVDMQGTSISAYTGTIYVPNGSINAGGTSSALPTINTQLVGKQVTVGGTSNININFNSDENYQVPAALDLMR